MEPLHLPLTEEAGWHRISSSRLILSTLPIPLLDALIAGDRAGIRQYSPLDFRESWAAEVDFLDLRRTALLADPDYAPWAPRAISRLADHRVIGHIGFHTRPGAAYLKETVPDGVELGYTIFEPYRGHGYAQEACLAMMRWARAFAGVTRFVLSIGPGNAPSLAIAAKLGFRQIGEQMDEIDGLEFVFAASLS